MDEKYKITTATWAGRWVPTDPILHCRMAAIKKAFDEFVAPKVSSPSSLASPFVKVCGAAFRSKGLGDASTFEDYVAEAELQVSGFLESDDVRCLALRIFAVFVERLGVCVGFIIWVLSLTHKF